MPETSFHLVVASLVLLIAAIIDLRTHRIPNLLLLFAFLIHLLFARLDGLNHRGGAIAFLVALILVVAPISGPWIMRNFGMGDVKLLVYLIWSIGAGMNWIAFLLAIGLSSLLLNGVLKLLRRSLDQSLPFAPFLGVGALVGVFF